MSHSGRIPMYTAVSTSTQLPHLLCVSAQLSARLGFAVKPSQGARAPQMVSGSLNKWHFTAAHYDRREDSNVEGFRDSINRGPWNLPWAKKAAQAPGAGHGAASLSCVPVAALNMALLLNLVGTYYSRYSCSICRVFCQNFIIIAVCVY